MDILQFWELSQDHRELLRKICLSELHFPHVETTDPGYLVMPVDDSRCLPLCLGQHDVREVLARGHHTDLLEIIVCHGEAIRLSL